MFELVVERTGCLVFLLIYKIFKRGFLHDSKRADRFDALGMYLVKTVPPCMWRRKWIRLKTSFV